MVSATTTSSASATRSFDSALKRDRWYAAEANISGPHAGDFGSTPLSGPSSSLVPPQHQNGGLAPTGASRSSSGFIVAIQGLLS
jgi:hypothetical protein